MRQIIFILVVLVSINLSAQRVNKYGEKVISEINVKTYECYGISDETIKFFYNDKFQLQSYEVFDNNKNKILEKTQRHENEMKIYTSYESTYQYITFYFDENNLIVRKIDLSEITPGRMMKLVWQYEYGEPYDNSKPYMVREIHHPYYKNSNENCYKLYKPDVELWETQYYKGIYENLLVSNGNKPHTSEYFEHFLEKRNLEIINDTNYDIVGLDEGRSYLGSTEWLGKKNLYFFKNKEFKYYKYEKDNKGNLLKITRYWENDVKKIIMIKYLY